MRVYPNRAIAMLGPLLVLSLLQSAHAAPSTGSALPAVAGRDLCGHDASNGQLVGPGTSVLLILTDAGGKEAVRTWTDRVLARRGSLPFKTIISLNLSVFVPEGIARNIAQRETPRARWHDVLLDVRGKMATELGLGVSRVPYLLLLDTNGRVLTQVHATADAAEARAFWKALDERRAAAELSRR